jgi:hypothetical protein
LGQFIPWPYLQTLDLAAEGFPWTKTPAYFSHWTDKEKKFCNIDTSSTPNYGFKIWGCSK